MNNLHAQEHRDSVLSVHSAWEIVAATAVIQRGPATA